MAAGILFAGITCALLTPLWRRSRAGASLALGVGALVCVAYALFDLTHPDMRQGLASVEMNRRFDLIALGFELPAAAFAVISLRYFQRLSFWLGWIFNLVYGLWLLAVVVYFAFFWHW